MGLFRRKREEPAPTSGGEMEGLGDGKVPWMAEQESIGRPVQGQSQAMPGFDLNSLGGIGAVGELFQQMQQMQAGITIEGPQQTIDASNSELGEKIKDVMRKHGIDPDTGAASANPAQMVAMQQEMMQLIADHQSRQSGS